MKVHVYSASFVNEKEAFKFATEMDYDDDESIPFLWENIGAVWLDEDFIEIIYGKDKFQYLSTLLKDKNEIESLQNACPKEHNTLFLIFSVKDTSNEDFIPKQCINPLYLGSPNATFTNT